MTGAEALARARAALAAADVPDPARDARALLAHALRGAEDGLILALPEPMSAEAEARLDAAVAARVRRQPVAQITGRRLFWGRAFRVTPDVLDPRPETETLIAEALAVPFDRVLDLGTGSGAILATLLAERTGATGLGTDLSDAALAVARENAQALGVAARADFGLHDWFAGVTGLFDLIVSNPPYIAADEMATLAPEVREWEPQLALTPGGDGLAAYRAIAAGAGAHLAPGGRVLVEIGASQGRAVADLFAANGFASVRVSPDLDGRDRVVGAMRA